MMSYRASRRVVRLHPSSSRAISFRVSPVLFGFQRVLTSCNAKYDISAHLQEKPFRSVNPQLGTDRGYATRPASRPKAHTGRTTSSPRVRKPKEASAETDVKVTVKAIKPKAKPKKKTAKPNAKSKAKSKAKPKAKLKAKAKPKAKSKAKPKAKVRAKKPKTAEQQAASKLKEQRARIRELKKIALKRPPGKPSTAWMVLCKEITQETHALPDTAASAKYKNLATEEHEVLSFLHECLSNSANSVSQHYNHIANQNKADNAAAYQTWIKSISPENIRKANYARQALIRLGIKGFKNHLQDDRQVKRPAGAHAFFLKDRYSSGDMHGIKATEALRQVSKEWRDLGGADKQVSFSHIPHTSALFLAPADIDDNSEIL